MLYNYVCQCYLEKNNYIQNILNIHLLYIYNKCLELGPG